MPEQLLELRHFIERVASYTMAPAGAVLRMAMSVPEALEPVRPRRVCILARAPAEGVRMTQDPGASRRGNADSYPHRSLTS